jgi:phenylalanyl-tRNA synthetase beta chain
MKVSIQWLSQYVDMNGITAADLAERMPRTGIEVDGVESRNIGVQGVVVGYVKSREKHPDADKLSVCIIDAGQAGDLQIVCGAQNVAAGQKVPVALIGAKLPGDFQIKRAKLRGVESQGMICSAKELGMNDKLLPKELQEGILVLPEDSPIGSDILELLGLNDDVLELDLTPNRSDCLSMLGVAYEVGAIFGRDVKLPEAGAGLVSSGTEASKQISVQVSHTEHCSHYAARLIEGVVIGPSPLWIQNRLMAAGVRPINNVVDITNFVMLEYGQPLHAFDADKLANGNIDVRLAREGERIVTLDDVDRALEPHMLLITDGEKPVALAGVMGGANSEVTANTSRILLESAKFAGSVVRRTSRQLGLRSEASLRFEKEVNPEAVIPALNRAAALMCDYAGGKVANGIVEAGSGTPTPSTIAVTVDRINQYLGTSLSTEEVASIWDRLHFSYKAVGGAGSFQVIVPSRRGDITRDVDLIEEVARLYGYDQIPVTLMNGVTTPGALSKGQAVRRTLRRLLTDSGVNEAVTYSLTHPTLSDQFSGRLGGGPSVALAMPMSEERSVLRTSLLPHLMEAAVYNRNRSNEDVALFEIGTVFVTEETSISKLPQETYMLALLLMGSRQGTHWTGKSSPIDFYDLKGIVDKALAFLGIREVTFKVAQSDGYHPGRTADISVGGRSIGTIGQLHPALQRDKDLGDTYVAEIELAAVFELAELDIVCRSLPRYPAVTRDAAVVVNRAVPAGDLQQSARAAAGELLESIEVFDVYVGDRLGADKKSIALSLVYRHPDRTLTDEDVTAAHGRVIDVLEQTHGAELRR